jgi:hypothetical protein
VGEGKAAGWGGVWVGVRFGVRHYHWALCSWYLLGHVWRRPAGGTVAPTPCGNVTVYCPTGSQRPQVAQPGYFTATNSTDDTSGVVDVMIRQLDCPLGYYCASGVRAACPAGTAQPVLRASAPTDCQACPSGRYCGVATAAPVPCGNASFYCPVNSSAPLVAGVGYFTPGPDAGTRSLCRQGSYCPGDGVAWDCPAGCVGLMLVREGGRGCVGGEEGQWRVVVGVHPRARGIS